LVTAFAVFGLFSLADSGVGSAATTEDGHFRSGTTRLSSALDIPVDGSPPYPLVVFVHDSGPNAKGEFEGWARRLVASGVATFRFDKRGVGDSDGEYRRGFVDLELLSGDLVAAIDFAIMDSRIDQSRVGLMGSSQAGWIMPMVATRSEHIAFTILLSGPAVTVAQHNFWVDIAAEEDATISSLSVALADFELPAGDFDPRPFIEQMTAPGLWLLGDQDRIIPARESAQVVRDVAAEFGRPFTTIVYPDAGHGLREVDGGLDCTLSFGVLGCDRVDFWADLLPWLDAVIR
jgi:hypothetical protein